jgi:hypothetical protein
MRWLCLLAGLVVLVALGCAASAPEADRAAGVKQKGAKKEAAQAEARGVPKDPVQRKIIYTATLAVVVEDFDGAEARFLVRLKERGGYVVHSDVEGGQPGSRRTGAWTVRVPAARFETFLDDVGRLGELRQRKVDSEDVTEQYHDTAEEIKNYQLSEAALLRLYDKKIASSRLEDVLKLQEQITEVQKKINVLKGRMKRWDKLTEYSTATVTLTSRKDYTPPVEPSFGSSISSTFRGSLDALVTFGKYVVLTAVALSPWLVLVVPLVALVAFLWRRAHRRPAVAAAQPISEVEVVE